MAEIDLMEIGTAVAKMDLINRARASLEQFSDYYQKNEKRLHQEFCQSFQALCNQGCVLQSQGKQQEIAYLAITVLRSLILEYSYQLRLDLYNASFYLDSIECSAYLDLQYLLKYIDTDIEQFIGALKECGGKYTSYDIEKCKKDYIEVYADFAQTLIEEKIPAILELKEFNLLKKTSDFKIIYGEYQDRTVTLYDAASESEEA